MCDIKSDLSAKPPVFADDIFKLNVLSLNSFILAYFEVNPKVTFICDFCPKEKYDAILSAVPFKHDVIYTKVGINRTALMQYDLALDSQEDTILFQECDYLYVPYSGILMEKAIRHFGLVSPYDNRNFYIDYSIHSKKTTLELFEDYHFRTVERNTMTFGMTKEAFVRNYDILKHYGYLDNEVWKEIAINNYPLWTPVPALATHMVADYLAPSLSWKQLWETLAPELRDTYAKPKS